MAGHIADYILKPEGRHKTRVLLAAVFMTAVIGWVAVHGFGYYRLSLPLRVLHPLHSQLRPSGRIGIRLAFLAVSCFCLIFLYAIRKRWRWLGKRGKTRNWLDLHVVMGIGAPILITFHSAFQARGIAGFAYWLMLAVMASGFIGRYLYSQIPRRINAAELSLQEMQAATDGLSEMLNAQSLVTLEELRPLLALPGKAEVEALSVLAALALMARHDVARPFQVARIRRRFMTPVARFFTVGGLLPSRQESLEKVIDLVRQRAWMATKISFLSKTHAVFHWWHVVHRPFSYSFAILAVIHIVVVVSMGYF